MEIPLTPLDFLARARRLFPNRVGVIDGDVRRTYQLFGDRCDRLAFALRDELGVRPGDRVAWLCGNTGELLEAYYGVLLAGGILLPLNIRLAPAESRFVVGDAGAEVLFRHPDQPDPFAGSEWDGPRQVVLGEGYEELLARQPAERFPQPTVDELAPAELFYTSGSTGTPKGVLLTHRGLYLHAVHSALTSGISGDDVIVHTIPLFHVNGWGTPHHLTGLGGVHVMLPRFDAGEVLRLIEAEGATRLFAVPAMLRALLDHPDIRLRDLSSLRQASVGGAPAGPALLAEAEAALGCLCVCGYGMTETGPSLTRALDKPGEARSAARRATTGLPIVGVDVRVLDDDDREVPWDAATAGEVCVRSNHVMAGYWNRPEDTAAALRGGWLRTGDVAVVDPDGYLTLVDRKKDLIISGGENISTVEVEHAIAAHPAVSEVAVVGVPDERWGEVPRAWVALRPGADCSADELLAHTRTRLAGFKTPREVRFLDELPHGGTGKILKHELRGRS